MPFNVPEQAASAEAEVPSFRDHEPLVHRHRPKRFEDVEGQSAPVTYLSGLIVRGQACRNILLHGSIGSGKTTLARIYAKALNCEKPSEKGSPCLDCGPCRSIEAGNEPAFTEIDLPQLRRLDELRERIKTLLSIEQRSGARRVIFIDEAHALKSPTYKDSSDFLLKLVEEPPPATSFCFATTAPGKIPDALRSRLVSLQLRPLPLRQGVEYLSRIARKEGIAVEPEALSLIIGLGEGQPRNMLQALDQVSDGAARARLDVTRERVIDMFGVSHTEFLVNYFMALGRGDFAVQTKTFFEWNEPVQLRARLVQSFLISLYYRDLRKMDIAFDPVIASISNHKRTPILDTFRQRLQGVDLENFWEDMIAAWPVITPEMSDEAVLAQVVAFQRLANRPAALPRPVAPPERVPLGDVARPRERQSRRQRGSLQLVRTPNLKPDRRYLTIEDVGQILRASSFAVQEYGVRFNTRITIRHGLFGCTTQAEASSHFGKFSQALDSRLKDWNGFSHRLGVQEVNEEDGYCGRMITFVRDRRLLERWSAKWRRTDREQGKEDSAIAFEVSLDEGPAAHWRCARWLCGGLDAREPLAEQLKIEPEFRRVAGDIGQRIRRPTSDSLKPGEMARIDELHGLATLSAFDDGAFDRLYDGWELEEHSSRLMHKRIRQAAVEEVRSRYEPADTPERKASLEAELVELRASWADKYARERTWTVWKPEP
jgi:DNA polymerase III subunit gamma/tau